MILLLQYIEKTLKKFTILLSAIIPANQYLEKNDRAVLFKLIMFQLHCENIDVRKDFRNGLCWRTVLKRWFQNLKGLGKWMCYQEEKGNRFQMKQVNESQLLWLKSCSWYFSTRDLVICLSPSSTVRKVLWFILKRFCIRSTWDKICMFKCTSVHWFCFDHWQCTALKHTMVRQGAFSLDEAVNTQNCHIWGTVSLSIVH